MAKDNRVTYTFKALPEEAEKINKRLTASKVTFVTEVRRTFKLGKARKRGRPLSKPSAKAGGAR